MELKDIKLVKGMTKEEVNKLTKDYILLENEVYLGILYKHNWKCLCGNLIENRTWDSIKRQNSLKCSFCRHQELEQKYKTEVEKDGEYEYIRSFRRGDVLPSGKLVNEPYIQIKHLYCGNIYEIVAGSFINQKHRCIKCCGSYENSFAYYIEVELGEPLDKYWDFDKNTVNPYHIWKGSDKRTIGKIWVKCQKVSYHGSYDITCNNFYSGNRCGYCHPKGKNPKIHRLDSFGQYLKDNNLLHLWSDKNIVDPFTISRSSGKKVWMLCGKVDYHNDYGGYEISCANLINGRRCSKCKSSKGEKRIKEYLDKNSISYIHDEPYFDDLLSDLENPLRPDFILPEHKIWIEYDGEFHFKKYYKDQNYETLKTHDRRKNEYAKKHGWKMIRIPYYEFDNIEIILSKELPSD